MRKAALAGPATTQAETPYAQLVLQWALSARTVNANDRAEILAREVEAVRSTRPALAKKIAVHRDALCDLSQSEDRCFESLSKRLAFAHGVVPEHLFEPDAVLSVAVRNHFVKVEGAEAAHAELAAQAQQLGDPVEEPAVWPQSESVFVFLRTHAVGTENANTKVYDTVTFHQERFTVSAVERMVLPSHSSCALQHISISGIDYLQTATALASAS